MKNLRKLSFVLVVCFVLTSSGVAYQKEASGKLRVLFIGNSYTYFNNLPDMFSHLAASAKPPRQVETQMVVRGGWTLKMHWEDGAALKALQQSKWDYVVLQEQSLLPITNPEMMHQYARLFDAEIKKAGAKTIFYLTWARQDHPEMQAKLSEGYQSIARELGALVAPVGIAWQNAFKENPQTVFHIEDKSHPNPAGSYMAACVLYATIFGKSPENLSGHIIGKATDLMGKETGEQKELASLDNKEAAFIQRIAWQTVLQSGSDKKAMNKAN